jgi:hypothetical protein
MPARVLRLSTVFVLLISLCVPAKAQGTAPQTALAEADRLAMLCNWPRALPLYDDAEREFGRLNDAKGVLEGRLGWLRAEGHEEPSPALVAEVDRDLRNPIIQGDTGLMLRCLAAKAAIEEEVNEDYSHPTWEKIQELAKRLNDRRWQARAQDRKRPPRRGHRNRLPRGRNPDASSARTLGKSNPSPVPAVTKR